MGSRQSNRGSRMSDRETGEETGRPDDQDEPDLATILSYLIRSGQVRILPDGGGFEEQSEDEDDDECMEPVQEPTVIDNPDTSVIDASEVKQEILLKSGRDYRMKPCQSSIPGFLQQREVGRCANGGSNFNQEDCCQISSNFLPNSSEMVACYRSKAFCGTYSTDGNIFLSACQDQHVRIYDTNNGKFKEFKKIRARDVGWSVIDTAFSPDGNYLCYSSWSDCIHLCNIHGDHETHEALPLAPRTHSFCIFSLMFSMDNREILGGANDGQLYIYDRDRNERILRIDAHDDDVNSVVYADNSSQILFSGGDDGLLKCWDRRSLSEENPEPVGTFAGHHDGTTYIDSKGDGRYFLSNSKDQTIKLWDMRAFSTAEAVVATKRAVSKQTWDYRWQHKPPKKAKKKIQGDTSVMTYMGHSVLHTLIRSRFSPIYTTGQRYIYTGCAAGRVVIYDLLTGKIEKILQDHRACVRDVSWHPYEHTIASTSWDGCVNKWTYYPMSSRETDSEHESDDESEQDGPRRSKRLRSQSRWSNSRRINLWDC